MPDQDAVDTRRAQRAEERRLFDAYLRERSPQAREAIVRRFMPLARQLARRYGQGGELEDLEQVAALGLLKAIERFDPQRGLAFSSFAFPTIAGELKRYLRDHAWSVRPPRELQETALRVDKATTQLTTRLGRTPTAGELAEAVGSSVEQVLEARQTGTARRAVSLDQPVPGHEIHDGDSLGATVGVDERGFAAAEDSATLSALVGVLSDRDRTLLRLRFEDELTQSQIGERLGISQMHVSRLIRAAIGRLQAGADVG